MSLQLGTGDSSIRDLPLQDPRCINDSCLAFLAAHTLSQAQVSYTLQFEYGRWVTWYYLIIIFIATIIHLFHLWIDRPRSPASERLHVSLLDKSVALWRLVRSHHSIHRSAFERWRLLLVAQTILHAGRL